MTISRLSFCLAQAGLISLSFGGAWAQAPVAASGAASPSALEPVTVTATRERDAVSTTPVSIGVIGDRSVRDTAPAHPQQILGQVPGVAIAVTNGEGHTTAIRQPFTTSPMYLFLEDGIPVRATGFFNHNALYEVNLPQAGSIEVIRGPGTALYGSDAIGGTVNVLSRLPSATPGAGLNVEAGSFGWRRFLGEATGPVSDQGAIRADLNLTQTDGWRARTAYDRQSLNARWDHAAGDQGVFKTLIGYTRIDQQTGANSALPWADYRDNPRKNNFAIAYRKVDALRLSTEYAWSAGPTQVSVIPYYRNNAMDLNGAYNLSSDPRIEKTAVESYGLMAKWRYDLGGRHKSRLLAGADLERSPGQRQEDALNLIKSGSGAGTNYTGYTVGSRIFDYAVTWKTAALWTQAEFEPVSRLRLSAGLRHDTMGFDMTNQLAAGASQNGSKYYGQIASASVDYSRLSPKLGATYDLGGGRSAFTSYNEAFRVPSESQLFRAGSGATSAEALAKARSALALRPIRAEQFELGVRGFESGRQWELVFFDLVKRDDLVSQKDLSTNVSTTVNAGKTRHRGVEAGLGQSFGGQWRVDVALSWARHTYEDWNTVNSSGQPISYSGKDMESAPGLIANTRLSWTPTDVDRVQIEWVRLGAWWLEQSNSASYGRYPGHDVFNLRVSRRLDRDMSLNARVMNLTDRRYADSASVSSNTPVFTPALPRALYVGVDAKW